MSKINKIKALLQSVLAQFAKLATDKGLLSFDGDELEVGMSVMLVDEEGNESVPEDGEYKVEDGTVYVIADGKVAEIREAENEQDAIGDDVLPEPEVREEENEDAPEEAPAEPEVDERDERIANLEAEVARLERENGELRERIAELEAKLEEPAAAPAEEQFDNINKVAKTGNKGLDNLNRILNA